MVYIAISIYVQIIVRKQDTREFKFTFYWYNILLSQNLIKNPEWSNLWDPNEIILYLRCVCDRLGTLI